MRRAAAVAAVLLALAVAVSARALTRPDPAAQAVADGCGRDDTAAISNLVPEWAYVGDASAPGIAMIPSVSIAGSPRNANRYQPIPTRHCTMRRSS